MKILLSILACLVLQGSVLAQFPPILRQSLTTNTAANPTAAGQTPVWSGATWLMLSTNSTGGGGNDNLWTNTASEYLPTRTNTFGFAKEAGGLWLGSNTPVYWGALAAQDALVSVRNAVAGETPNNNFYFLTRGTATNETSVEGSATANSSQILVHSTNDIINAAYVQLLSQVDGVASVALVSNLTTRASVNVSGESYLNGDGVQLGIGTTSPDAPLHVVGASFLQGGITNWGRHRHTNGAFEGAIFTSTNASGDAIWSTNIPSLIVTNLYVTNLFVTNINGIPAGSFTNVYWTNDTAVLKGTPGGLSPRAALRWGLLGSGPGVGDGTNYWNLTNVGFCSFAVGTNVIARGDYSIAGGSHTIVQTNALASIAWGSNSVIQASNHSCVISGGSDSEIGAFGRHATIAGGFDHSIGASTVYATISGGQQNVIDASVSHGTVSGGSGNRIRANHGVISGGTVNDIISGVQSVIGGGIANNVQSGANNTIGGGNGNLIGHSLGGAAQGNVLGGGVVNSIGFVNGANTSNSFLGGGWFNTIGSSSHHSVMSGGERNAISESPWGFVGGGLVNSVSDSGTNSSVVGGASNRIMRSGWSFIGGGLSNYVNGAGIGNFHAILGGSYNQITNSGGSGFIVGSSNRLTIGSAGVIGFNTTNNLGNSIDVGVSGKESTELTKSTFTSTNTIIRTSLATAPDTVVTLAADNQVVDITKRSYVRIQSDSAVAGDRTFVLTGTNVAAGARITLEWVGTNAGELVDDAAMSGAGNQRMSATWTPTQYDSVSFIFNGTDVIETARSTN